MDRNDPAGIEDLYNDIDFAVLLQIAGRSIGHYVESVAKETGYSAGQLSLLGMIHRKPGLIQNTYSTILSMDDATLARHVGKLERQGLLTRQRSTRDRRSFRLQLSPEGAALVQDVLHRLSGVREQLRAQLPERKLQQLHGNLVEFLVAQGRRPEQDGGQE